MLRIELRYRRSFSPIVVIVVFLIITWLITRTIDKHLQREAPPELYHAGHDNDNNVQPIRNERVQQQQKQPIRDDDNGRQKPQENVPKQNVVLPTTTAATRPRFKILDVYVNPPPLDPNKANLNCSLLFQYKSPEDDMRYENLTPEFLERRAAINLARQWHKYDTFTVEELLELSDNCETLQAKFLFPQSPQSIAEVEFPLAYVIFMRNYPLQSLNFLKAIYWPQNTYCIYVDGNQARRQMRQLMQQVAQCYENIFVLTSNATMILGHYSALQAAMSCLEELRKTQRAWRYVQIVEGTDFPLKTNREMVEILKSFNGANDAELNWPDKERYVFKYPTITESHPKFKKAKENNQVNELEDGFYLLTDRSQISELPPGNIYPYKGSNQAIMTRDFVHFIIENEFAQEFYRWLRDTLVPDEFFYSTLIHNMHLNPPGGFPGHCLVNFAEQGKLKPVIIRHQIWPNSGRSGGHSNVKCRGKMKGWICQYGLKDLMMLSQAEEFFARKFSYRYEPATLYCLQELIDQKTYLMEPQKMIAQLNWEYYRQMPNFKFANFQNDDERDQYNCSLEYFGNNNKG